MTADDGVFAAVPASAHAVVIAAAELVSKGDPRLALILLEDTDVQPRELQRAALIVFSFVMSGEASAERFSEVRTRILELSTDDGANVVLELEVVGAAELLERGDLAAVDAVVSGSTFTPGAFAWTAAALTGQAVVGWLGPQRARGFWAALRGQYGVTP